MYSVRLLEFANIEKIRDCADLVDVSDKESGIYQIHPYRSQEGLFVQCDLDTDDGGWTVRSFWSWFLIAYMSIS